MGETPTDTVLIDRARVLLDAVSHDENGAMVAGKWVGGNGGMISRATIKAADALRLALNAHKQEAGP